MGGMQARTPSRCFCESSLATGRSINPDDCGDGVTRYVIGPGGQTVKTIESETGAKITVTREDESKIIVRGSPEARKSALDMVRYLLVSQECVMAIELDASAVEQLLSDGAGLLAKIEAESGVCVSIGRVGGGRDGEVLVSDGGKVCHSSSPLSIHLHHIIVYRS